MTSVPLLLERRVNGLGPKIPLRSDFYYAVVEGLAQGDAVVITCEGTLVGLFSTNGKHPLEKAIEKGSTVQAKLCGENSCASVLLEDC